MGRIGTVVVVAKVPRAGGKSKTRLIPLLGAGGATALARAMLMDVLSTLQEVECHRVVLYAPPTDEARNELRDLLDRLPASSETKKSDSRDGDAGRNDDDAMPSRRSQWTLMEMQHATLQDSNLSHALAAAAKAIVSMDGGMFPDTSALVFVGMDAPELDPMQVREALNLTNGEAMLCPAQDGGYGLLGVSLDGTQSREMCGRLDALFHKVLWSHPLTALSQIRAAQLAGFGPIRLGPVLRDVDLPDDVTGLCQRLARPSPFVEIATPIDAAAAAATTATEADDLGSSEGPAIPPGTTEVGGRCQHTRQALQSLGLLLR